jgi:hypothetical protein
VLAADDSYTESLIGMTGSNELRATFDVSWAISERSSAYLMIGNDSIDAAQLGSQQFGDADWQAAHTDEFNHIGIGVVWWQLAEKVDLRLDYNHGVGKTRIDMLSESNGASPLPELKSNLDSLRMEAMYRVSDRWDATLDLRYESFSTQDWALQDVNQDTLPTVLTLGADPYDYNVWALGLGFRYTFGGQDIALVN